MAGDHSKGASYQRQAQSDYQIARCLRALQNGPLLARDARCHIASMCQQSIEKSVKSLYVAMRLTPKRTHQVTGLIIDMITVASGTIRSQLCRVFSPSARQVACELGDLVPKSNLNDPSQVARNNEYPFLINREWIAPCDDSAFRDGEITRFLREAGRIVDGVTRIRAAIYRSRID